MRKFVASCANLFEPGLLYANHSDCVLLESRLSCTAQSLPRLLASVLNPLCPPCIHVPLPHAYKLLPSTGKRHPRCGLFHRACVRTMPSNAPSTALPKSRDLHTLLSQAAKDCHWDGRRLLPSVRGAALNQWNHNRNHKHHCTP